MAEKNKGKNGKKVGHVKAAGMGLEGFVDWVDPISNETVEDREDDMSSLTTRFVARMRKRVARTQGETTSILKYQATST